jgi:hypothetical protein
MLRAVAHCSPAPCRPGKKWLDRQSEACEPAGTRNLIAAAQVPARKRRPGRPRTSNMAWSGNKVEKARCLGLTHNGGLEVARSVGSQWCQGVGRETRSCWWAGSGGLGSTDALGKKPGSDFLSPTHPSPLVLPTLLVYLPLSHLPLMLPLSLLASAS